MIPHLLGAIRVKAPHGTTLAWSVMIVQAGVWAAYGLIAEDYMIAAPTAISGPIAMILAVWSYRYKKRLTPMV